MTKFEFTRNPDGIVQNLPDEIESAVTELAGLFKCDLNVEQALLFDRLMFLWGRVEANADWTKKGWDQFIATFREVEEIVRNEGTVEITDEAYARLKELFLIESKKNPKTTFMDYCSKIFMAIPMPG